MSGVVICLATAAVDAAAVANREELAAAFPARGREVRDMLVRGAPVNRRGLVLLDPMRRGTAGLSTLAVDGRRTPAPHRDYATFLRARRSPARVAGRTTLAGRTTGSSSSSAGSVAGRT